MDYTGLPHIHGRPFSAGATWDLTNRLRADDRHVRFDASRSGRDAQQLRDQLRQCQEEMVRKDRLLSQLTPGVGPQWINGCQVVDSGFGEQRVLLDRIDNLQMQLRETQLQLERRDKNIHELQHLIDSVRDSEARHLATVQQLRRQLTEYEHCPPGGALFNSPPGGALFNNMPSKEAYDRINDLENRLRTHMEERERAEQQRLADERKLTDSIQQLNRLLIVDTSFIGGGAADYYGPSVANNLEQILNKTREVVQDNTVLRSKVVTLQSSLETMEIEQRSNRETIQRMVNDHQNIAQFNIEMDNLRLERDAAVGRQKDLQTEIESLRDRLDASQRAWSSMRHELEGQKLQRSADIDRERMTQAAESQIKAFKECLARMLSDNCVTVQPFEEAIRERVQNIIVTLHDKSAQIESLEGKLSKLASQLDAQYELNRAADRKTRRAEADMTELEQKLRQLECSALVPQDGVRIEQERYVRLLEHINRALGMTAFPPGLTLDGATSAIISRAEQLCAVETDRGSLISSLRHKVKSLKDKLTDKLMRVEALERRVSAAEAELSANRDIDRDKDDVYTKNRKLVSLVEKYRCELNEAHLEIRDLKARLLVTADLQLAAETKERDIVSLEAKVGQLEHVRQRQADELFMLKESREAAGEKREETMRRLNDDNKRLQFTLNDITRRQQELLALRQVIARMLGLNVGPTTAADFEIVSRVEKLIIGNRDNMTSTIPVDAAFQQLAQSYRQGQLTHTGPAVNGGHHSGLGPQPRPHTSITTAPGGKTRSRSMSPVRKRDTKVY